jgi:hypothetical protein
VSLIEIYKQGFEILDTLPEEDLLNFYKIRESEINYIMEVQFILAYLGHVSKLDSDEMTWFELTSWFSLLKKQKELENQKSQEQIK